VCSLPDEERKRKELERSLDEGWIFPLQFPLRKETHESGYYADSEDDDDYFQGEERGEFGHDDSNDC